MMSASWKKRLASLLSEKERVILAIDGPCASGKTTLAQKLYEEYGAAVIRMDDFFLQPHQRTPKRLSEPGGNVDRERFYEEVVCALAENRPVSYRPYSCQTGTLQSARTLSATKLVIVEGSYSLHPFFGFYWDMSLFLTISSEEQAKRIRKRNPQTAERFFAEWIPMEETYFAQFSIEQKCDFILEQEKLG